MTPASETRDSQRNLADALNSGLLSQAIAQQGHDILARMQKPLRLSILGMPGCGKSTLMNLLLGAQVVPIGVRLPTLSMTYGEDSIAECMLPNGEKRSMPATDMRAIAALNPIFVEATMPLPALAKLSVMEVVAGRDVVEQKRALTWAAKRTDIALWCTETFHDTEQLLWALMPEGVQDHSFLLLSKADQLDANGNLPRLLKSADERAGDSFRHLLPISAKMAISATKPDGSINKDALRSSGGVALISAILREVEAGYRAAADQADIFLRQIDYDPDHRDEPATKIVAPAPIAKATAPSPKVQAEPLSVPLAATDDPQPPKVEDAPVAEVTKQPPAPLPMPNPALQAKISPEAREACSQGVAQLSAEGEALVVALQAGGLSPDAVLDVSVDTVSWLADYLGDSGAANDPVLERARAAANDAADLVQLIQLETGENVALDALSLMIQLKHELQAEIAA